MSDEGHSAERTRFREPAARTTRTPAASRSAGRTRFVDAKTSPAPSDASPAPTKPAEPDAVAVVRPGRCTTVLAVVATAVAVVMLAVAVVFAVLYVRSRNNADELAATRTTVLRTAQKTAIDFSSYDYRRLDRDFAGVASQLTPDFRRSYQKTAGSLKATLSQYRAVGTAKVLAAGVATLSANRASVVVFLDQTVTSKTSTTPTVDRNRILVQLQRSGQRWLVSKLDVR